MYEWLFRGRGKSSTPLLSPPNTCIQMTCIQLTYIYLCLIVYHLYTELSISCKWPWLQITMLQVFQQKSALYQCCERSPWPPYFWLLLQKGASIQVNYYVTRASTHGKQYYGFILYFIPLYILIEWHITKIHMHAHNYLTSKDICLMCSKSIKYCINLNYFHPYFHVK